MKKAFDWMDARGMAYRFHDYKKAGIDAATLSVWADEAGWERLLNRQGTTWRALADAEKEGVDRSRAIALMVERPSLIKRPVITGGAQFLVGFDTTLFNTALEQR